jgi:large subunit ribosomal protein L30
MLKITLVKSVIGNTPRNRATVKALGLGKTGRSVLQEDTAVIRGMIHHVKHLLNVEVVDDQPKTQKRRDHNAAQPTNKPAKAAKPAPATEAKAEAKPKAETPKAAAPKADKATDAPAKPKRTTKKTEEKK